MRYIEQHMVSFKSPKNPPLIIMKAENILYQHSIKLFDFSTRFRHAYVNQKPRKYIFILLAHAILGSLLILFLVPSLSSTRQYRGLLIFSEFYFRSPSLCNSYPILKKTLLTNNLSQNNAFSVVLCMHYNEFRYLNLGTNGRRYKKNLTNFFEYLEYLF